MTIQVKATEQYFPVVLFITGMLYKVVLTFESVDESLKCDHSMKATEQYYTVVLVIMLYKGGSNFWVCGWNPSVWPFIWKRNEQFFPVVLFIMHHLTHLKINKIFFLLCGSRKYPTPPHGWSMEIPRGWGG